MQRGSGDDDEGRHGTGSWAERRAEPELAWWVPGGTCELVFVSLVLSLSLSPQPRKETVQRLELFGFDPQESAVGAASSVSPQRVHILLVAPAERLKKP